MGDSFFRTPSIPAPVPVTQILAEENNKIIESDKVGCFIVQNRFDRVMQAVANMDYDYNNPTECWYYIGKTVSKAFFHDEFQLKWFNTFLVNNREFLVFRNVNMPIGSLSRRQMVEIAFLKPQPGELIKMFYKPVRGVIRQQVRMFLQSPRAWDNLV